MQMARYQRTWPRAFTSRLSGFALRSINMNAQSRTLTSPHQGMELHSDSTAPDYDSEMVSDLLPHPDGFLRTILTLGTGLVTLALRRDFGEVNDRSRRAIRLHLEPSRRRLLVSRLRVIEAESTTITRSTHADPAPRDPIWRRPMIGQIGRRLNVGVRWSSSLGDGRNRPLHPVLWSGGSDASGLWNRGRVDRSMAGMARRCRRPAAVRVGHTASCGR